MNGGHARASAHFVRRQSDAVVVAGGLAVTIAGMLAVRHGSVTGFEKSTFHAINNLPGAFYPVLWPFQQLGNLLVGPLVAIVAALLRRFRLALALLIATVAKLGLERLVKSMVSRQRPGTSTGGDIHLRGDVSLRGESFVSGHAVLVTAIACLVVPYLRGRWKIVPWIVVGIVMVTRVYVGAHNPLDVICGAAVGLVIGGLLNLAFGVPDAEQPLP